MVVTLWEASWLAGKCSRQDRVEVTRADEDEVLHLDSCVVLRWQVTC